MSAFGVKGLTWGYPNREPLFQNLFWAVDEGKLTCLLGANGSGKTTLLLLAAGIDPATRFGVWSMPVISSIHFVLQEGAQTLLPWRTVTDNVAMPLVYHGATWNDARRQSESLLKSREAFSNLYHHRNAYPHELSGGLQQLTVVARAFLIEAQVFVFDEPFKGLDVPTRANIRGLCLDLLSTKKECAIVLVTHSPEEAILVADDIHLLPYGNRPITQIIILRPEIDRSRRLHGAQHLYDIRRRIAEQLGEVTDHES